MDHNPGYCQTLWSENDFKNLWRSPKCRIAYVFSIPGLLPKGLVYRGSNGEIMVKSEFHIRPKRYLRGSEKRFQANLSDSTRAYG